MYTFVSTIVLPIKLVTYLETTTMEVNCDDHGFCRPLVFLPRAKDSIIPYFDLSCSHVFSVFLLFLDKSIVTYSGHYKPSMENLVNFMKFLEESGVDLKEIKVARPI